MHLLLTLKKYKQHDMYFTTYLSSLIHNIHKVLDTQETVWEQNTIQGNQTLALERCN